ncbi:hypothetical protein WA1_24695 [Scytonema hofmannii PCC 7110]|uniref:CHAT domain-containing protein n=1 Tax=Scytonema hofmannii PCC 7110 TaxID=128403 RepID=A0A139X805_9CYAN|nr:CHAT domain-containing protein [Scytonema hofmannii]KYC40824.1 hypothetical protein WA1_24695 [Scytonema hofmannii PCC 7110]
MESFLKLVSKSIFKSISILTLALLLTFFSEIPVSNTTKISAKTSENGDICQLKTSISPIVLETQSKCLYETGRYEEAARSWEQTAKAYQRIGDKINQGLALSNLSLSYQKLEGWKQAERHIQASLQLLRPGKNQNTSYNQLQAYAQALDIQANLAYTQSLPTEALKTWKQAEQIYSHIKDNFGLMVNQLNQAQALQILGSHLQAQKILCEWKEILTTSNSNWRQLLKPTQKNQVDSKIQSQGLRILSNTYTLLGNLDESEQVLQKAKNLNLTAEEKAAVLLSLGNTQRAKAKNLRELREANEYKEYKDCKWYESEQNQEITQQDEDKQSESQYIKDAFKSYQQAVDNLNQAIAYTVNNNSNNSSNNLLITKLQIQLNQISLLSELLESNAKSEAEKISSEIKPKLKELPEGRIKIFAQINLAQSLMCLEESKNQSKNYSYEESAELISDAYKDAQKLGEEDKDGKKVGDKRAMSYALGSLGRLYEKTKQFSEAEKVTRQALSLAQSISAPDITYQWQWQLGRIIVKNSGEKRLDEAIKVYEEAAETLRTIRGDLLANNRDVQFSFRDNIEPVYRELIDLLLPDDKPNYQNKLSLEQLQLNLKKSLYYADSLQLAELENFFDCTLQNLGIEKVNLNSSQKDNQEILIDNLEKFQEKEKDTALIFPLILKNKLAVIVKLPGAKKLSYYVTKKKAKEVLNKILQVRHNLTRDQKQELLPDIIEPYKELYQWLIEPYSKDLESSSAKSKPLKLKQLVFILDSSLRSIPIASLHNGKSFFIDTDYTVSISPSVQLLKTSQNNSQKLQFKALIAESTVARGDVYDPLIQNPKPSEVIQKALGKYNPLVLSNGEFTKENFEEKLNKSSYNIVHLITHGTFSSNLKNTFILTDDQPQIKLDNNDFQGNKTKIDKFSININALFPDLGQIKFLLLALYHLDFD